MKVNGLSPAGSLPFGSHKPLLFALTLTYPSLLILTGIFPIMKSSFYVSVPLTLAFVASASLAPYEPPTYPFNPYPTIVFITGAFHVDSAMDILSGQLQQAGYNTRIRSLISVNAPGINVQNDTDALRQDFLQPLIEQQGLDIVLCLHSYAGFPGSAAIAGFSKQERASKGLLGGIIGLIYQSAFIPREGDTVAKDIGGFMSLWQVVNVRPASIFSIPPPVRSEDSPAKAQNRPPQRSQTEVHFLRRRTRAPGQRSCETSLRTIACLL